MTPAALHRLSFKRRGFKNIFCGWVSALVIAAPGFLAAGIGAETFVVLHKVFFKMPAGRSSARLVSFVALIGLWYAIPAWLRIRLKR